MEMRKLINLKRNKKGNILTENIIFLILNIVFISILILFVFLRMGSAAVLEERYSKQIALMIDSAEEGMVIELDMKDAIKIAVKENWNLDEVILIKDNLVTVRLREKGGYSYSFFSDFNFDGVDSNYYIKSDKTGFVFVIN